MGDSEEGSRKRRRGDFLPVFQEISGQPTKILCLPGHATGVSQGEFKETSEKNHFTVYILFVSQGSKVFRWHALRVINIFQKAVDAFDTDDATGNLLKIWEKVAQNHINRRISKESFNELKGILLDVMTAACSLDQEGQEAWLALIDNIYAIIFANYDASMQ